MGHFIKLKMGPKNGGRNSLASGLIVVRIFKCFPKKNSSRWRFLFFFLLRFTTADDDNSTNGNGGVKGLVFNDVRTRFVLTCNLS